MKIVYCDTNVPGQYNGCKRGGSAWWVRRDPDRVWDEHFGEFNISPELYWSLFQLGIIDAFCELPTSGLLGAYEEGIVLSSGLTRASEVLRRQVDRLSGGAYEWSCGKQLSPEKIEYKIIVNGAVLKEELVSLADFLSGAASRGFDVQFWL